MASSLAFSQSSRSFELRYFSPDKAANGETDFKGKTAVFSTDQRVAFLKQYADLARQQFDDPQLDTQVVTDAEVTEALNRVKAAPRPQVRQHQPLTDWKYLGYRAGQHNERRQELARWNQTKGAALADGYLRLDGRPELLTWRFASQAWRFTVSWQAKVPRQQEVQFQLSDRTRVPAATVGFGADGRLFYTTARHQRVDTLSYAPDRWHHFRVEVDLSGGETTVGRYNLYVDDRLVADYVPLERASTERLAYNKGFSTIGQVNTFAVQSAGVVELDDLLGIGYALTDRDHYPYVPETFLDEIFQEKPDIAHWTDLTYDDRQWEAGQLPLGHGSERFAEEDLYLRKKVEVGSFDRAFLNIETLDPGGEVWVNGQRVAVIDNRYPNRLDIGTFLMPNQTNQIAIKVNHFMLTEAVGELMPHSLLDLSIGWLAGRMSLDLVSAAHIESAYAHTLPLTGKADVARLKTQVNLRHGGVFRGRADIALFPWYPIESDKAAAMLSLPVNFTDSLTLTSVLAVNNPTLWTAENPSLYRVQVTLRDSKGKAIDDHTFATGLRTIDQQGGHFRLNGQVSMLNGAQIMGFRGPLEKMAVWQRCPPIEWIARELLMVKKMNGNLLRIHVHAWENSNSEGINDPRIAELADQLGVMLVWITPSWIRTGTDWRQIDFAGMPRYMRQVMNHPSIVVWEASNHPQSFKGKPVSESDAFTETIYNTVYPVDSSRLISLSSYLFHLHYGNDVGTIDYKGNPIKASWAYTAPMVTRGNQDSPTGYTKDWSELRRWPDAYRQDLLNSPERAYFDFEHEESMAQPNWELLRGKTYYRVHSYEWPYDVGTIGRKLTLDEWAESQAWQAFSAWEAMKKMRSLDYDGFSWCTLHGGPNSGTYMKPIIDVEGHAKLAYWVNKMVFQPTVAGSGNVDVVYGPDDTLTPVVMHYGPGRRVTLTVTIQDEIGKTIEEKKFDNIKLATGRNAVSLPAFRPAWDKEGHYRILYQIE
ncbi:hypothetical protein GCM10007390_48060 [Persicitalea jodogahamensis]|uniref:Glycoside hydrolase family 2 immunoglobulin-like beta-sandwich domain-containing protein n=1 Tax=Persicitalea jodogahamensis TaxID=402147 RepID=A0A8J3D884_9BACT|nr:hypothetical protein GCM10007390_48060 [Persicitalea jodogahamensis]